MDKYKTAKLYKLLGTDDSFYIGSTCKTLNDRFTCHKCRAKINPERKVYKHFNQIGWENVKIILLEEFVCNSKEELLSKEQTEIEKHKLNVNCLNTMNAFGFDKKEYLKEYLKKYREINKEQIKQYHQEYKKEYSEANKEKINQKYICKSCGGRYTTYHKNKHEKSIKHKNSLE